MRSGVEHVPGKTMGRAMAELVVWIISAGAVISLFIAFIRLITAGTEADRVVALDIVFSSGVALTGAAAVAQSESHFLDIGIALSVVGFVGTTLWARFIEAAGVDAPDEGQGRNTSRRPAIEKTPEQKIREAKR